MRPRPGLHEHTNARRVDGNGFCRLLGGVCVVFAYRKCGKHHRLRERTEARFLLVAVAVDAVHALHEGNTHALFG